MEEEDYKQLLIPEKHSSPGPDRKLKRLKKAFEAPKSPLLDSLLQDDESRSPELSSKSLDSTKSNDGLLGSEPRSVGFERQESEEFDELFPWEEERSGAKRVLEFSDEGDGSGDGFGMSPDPDGDNDEGENQGSEGIGDYKKEKRKRVKSNGDGKERKKKKKEDKSVGAGRKPKVSKRKEKQERKAEVALLVEHQRQLRERRDVAFKPLSVVQKPVSSVLERIRQRKKQVSVKAAVSISNQFSDPLREIMLDSDSEEVVIVNRKDCERKSLYKDQVNPTALKDDHLHSSPVEGSDEDSTQLADGQNSYKRKDNSGSCLKMHASNELQPLVEDKEPSSAFRAPTNDTQDLFSESQTSDAQDNHLNAGIGSPEDEDFAPCLPSMNLKLDSVPVDDISSEEEESDKENINPLTERLFKENLSPKGDPVKEFVDEEALEEDCSDDERRRFEDEGEDDSDAEEIAEMIATDYKEKPVDRERCDELHQLWLAQQDEAGTEHLLQKLKCGIKQKDATLLEEDEGRNTDEMDDEFGSEEDPTPTNVARVSTKTLRQMIPQMFTDKDDGYISSDDEETERRLNKQRLLGKVETKEHITFVSPSEDETSREVFGRIKKLNIVPETKKKVKTSSFFQNVVTKGSNSNSTKSSFLHRMASIPVSSKRASNTVKSFIFGRDESNSRTSISASEEEPSDTMNQAENSSQRKRAFTAKFSSQARSSTQSSSETSHRTSLIDILKRSSVQASHFARDNDMVDHQAVFAAFKSSKRSLKIEARS